MSIIEAQRLPAAVETAPPRTTVMTEEILAGIAHDIRNVLVTMDAGLRLADSHADEPDKVRRFARAAREAAERGIALTTYLLDSAKPQQHVLVAEDLSALVRRIDTLLRYAAGPDVRLVFDLAGGLRKCRVDQAAFTSAMVNLVLNAREAMPGGGMIHISAEHVDDAEAADGDFVRLRVCDTGQGMPPQVMERMFVPFFTTKGDKGTGLGLPQLETFMRRCGGYVRAVSRPGEGSTFDLYFPCSDTGAGTQPDRRAG